MRKTILLTLSVLLSSSILLGENDKKEYSIAVCSEPEAFIPASAALLIKVTKIERALDFLNAGKEYLDIRKLLLKSDKGTQLFRNTDIYDLLNTKSLREFGIDVNKALYLAQIENEKKTWETIYMIPITDIKGFPLKVVRLLKKMAENKTSEDLNPAISYYKGFKVFQILNSIFYTIIDDYFILTSSGNSLSGIIDLKLKGCETSLVKDPQFRTYKDKYEALNASNIINIFIKKDYIDRIHKELVRIKTENKEDKEYIPPKFNSVNYIALGLNSENYDISMDGVVSVNKDDPLGDLLMKAVTTGMHTKALYAEDAAGYHFISLDISKINSYLNELQDKDERIYRAYTRLMKSPERKKLFEDIVLPCSKSFINVVLKKSQDAGGMDNFVLFIPMSECGEIEGMMKKIKSKLKKSYSANQAFGEEKINGYNSFWIKTDDDNKISILESDGNLFAGNNIEFIRTMLSTHDKNVLNINSDFAKRMDKNTFLLSYSRFDDESFIKAILMMLVFNKSPELNSFISKVDSLNLTGEKYDTDFVFNMRVKMLPGSK